MGEIIEIRPEVVTEEHLQYLDVLRENGETNMFGASEWLEIMFGLDRNDARTILLYWMHTFSERHPK